jgi:hypothetical protein
MIPARCHADLAEWIPTMTEKRGYSGLVALLNLAVAITVAVVGYFTLEASTRAWVGPVKAIVDVNDGGVVIITVTYKNAGKEPAIEFGDDWADDWAASIDANSPDVNFHDGCMSDSGQGRCGERAARWQRKKCEQKSIFQDRVAFPDFTYTHTKTGLIIDKNDNNRIVVVQGCFIYKSRISLRSIQRTAFCYYYRIGQIGKEMRACPVGNSAT